MTLDEIALKHGTDKASNVHGYTKYYERFFDPMKDDNLFIFECGYGGYSYPDRGGESARMWRDYFPSAAIITVDIYNKSNVPPGVFFYKDPQNDIDFWRKIFDRHVPSLRFLPKTIFVDDGSHISSKSLATFKAVFPLLKPGGIYVLEDCHTNYWSQIASDGTDFEGGLRREGTPIELFKSLVDEINGDHCGLKNQYDIESIHFFEKIVFIIKK